MLIGMYGKDFGVILKARRWVDMELPEMTSKIHVLFDCKILIPKKDYKVLK